MNMKLRLTSRDFLLLIGIAVATLIVVTTLFYRDALVSVHPQVSKKGKETAAAVLMKKSVEAVSGLVQQR
jgi:hypothetical protein